MSSPLRPYGLQHARLPCPSPTSKVCSDSCPSNQWCNPAISSSVVPFSSCLQTFPASGSFPMSQFFTSGSPSIGVSTSASILPMNIQDWFSLGLTGLISLHDNDIGWVNKWQVLDECQWWTRPWRSRAEWAASLNPQETPRPPPHPERPPPSSPPLLNFH